MPSSVRPTPGQILSPRAAYPALVFTVFLWTIGIIITRAVHDTIPPLGLSFFRWFVAGLVLVPFPWPQMRENWTVLRANLWMLCGLGAVMTIGGTLMVYSAHFTGAINITLVNSSQPAMTAMLLFLATREKLSRRQVLGLIAAAAGIAVMVTEGNWRIIANLDFNQGDLLVVLGTVFYSVYAINLRRIPQEIGLVSAPIITIGGSLFVLPFYIAETVISRPVPMSLETLAAIFGISVFASSLALILWNGANRAVGPNRAAIFTNLLPVFGAAMAIPFLGESLFAHHFAGAALVCGGIFLVVRR